MKFEAKVVTEFKSLFNEKLTKNDCTEVSFYDGTDDVHFKIRKENENEFLVFRATEKKHYDCIFDFENNEVRDTRSWNLELPKNMVNTTLKLAVDRLKEL